MKKAISILLILCMFTLMFPLVTIPVIAEENTYPQLTDVPEGYIGIYTKKDLNNVRNNLNANYILMNDIIFEDTDFAEGGDFYNDGLCWKPIVSLYQDDFSGTFDGNQYSISNLYITIPKDSKNNGNVGLFKSVSGNIKNLCIYATVTIDVANCNFGAITGENKGIIEDCLSFGSLSSSLNKGSCAGIAGKNSGTIIGCVNCSYINANSSAGGITGENEGNINQCFNMGFISNMSSIHVYSELTDYLNVGGIAGKNYKGIINECYNAGSIYVKNGENTRMGGISGNNFGNIVNCFNVGSVTYVSEYTSAYLGGIAGYNYFNTVSNAGGDITFCYNLGNINSLTQDENKDKFGAIVGITFKDNQCNNCYFLNTGIKDIGDGSGLNFPLTLEEMKNKDSFNNFDFDSVWEIGENENYPFPELKQTPFINIGRSGDINNDFLINASDALLVLQYSVNKIELDEKTLALADIDRNNTITAADALLILQAAVGKIVIL